MKKVLLLLAIFFISFLPLISATHYIKGFVEDARDGTEANGHTILLWNSTNGITDNLTDIIGPSGNSGLNNSYQIDCELLDTLCVAGNILTLKVINNGNNYVSEERNVTVTSSENDSVNNITLNSIPEVNLIFPINFANFSDPLINFNCSGEDLDNNLQSISLYGNWSGGWHLNETKSVSGGNNFSLFIKNFIQGIYKYGCRVTDNLSISSFSTQNNTFTVDLTKPIINSVEGNISSACGIAEKIRVNCTTYDELLNIDKVIIQAISPLSVTNYSAFYLSGNTYYLDIPLNETGSWTFKCISNDSAGNFENLISEEIQVYSSSPDLFINFSTINLSKINPMENEEIKINALIENLGCSNVQNVLVGFFEGDPDISGINIGNITINIGSLSSNWTNLSWNAKIGPNNLFVFADSNFSISEDNETNNKANRSFSINSWQDIYGNASVDKIIGNNISGLKKWFNKSEVSGGVFIADSECSINWMTLQAIGKTKSGLDSSNDFAEIDTLLEMSNFEDSVSKVFSNNQIPKETKTMLLHQKEILNIPIINSTENSNFVTGILWDYSDDSDGEFGLGDEEDIIFVADINKETEGTYGIYDYQIKIPSKLREYKSADSTEVYLYYELN